jgi:hypothetical protein
MTSPSPAPLTIADLVAHLLTLPQDALAVMSCDHGAATATIQQFSGLSDYGHYFDINESKFLNYTN